MLPENEYYSCKFFVGEDNESNKLNVVIDNDRTSTNIRFHRNIVSDKDPNAIKYVLDKINEYHDICHIPKSLNFYDEIYNKLLMLTQHAIKDNGHLYEFKDFYYDNETHGNVFVHYEYDNIGAKYASPQLSITITFPKK